MSFKEKEDTTNSILVYTIYPIGYMGLLCTKCIKNAEKIQAYACQTQNNLFLGITDRRKKICTDIFHLTLHL